MKKKILISGVIFSVIALAGSVIFIARKKSQIEKNTEQTQQKMQDNQEQEKEQKEAVSSDFKTYRNDEYGFSLQYPQHLTLVTGYDDEQFTSIRFLNGGKDGSFAFSILISNRAEESLEEKELANRKLEGKTKYITFANMAALETHYSGSPHSGAYDQIYLIRDNRSYSFSFSTGKFSSILETKDRIKNSIKFD